MSNNAKEEMRIFRKTLAGQVKNVLSLLCVPVGLFFWLRDRNLVLAIPMALMAPIALQLPSLLYRRISWLHKEFSCRLEKIYEFSVCVILTLSISGSAYLFYLKYQFDILVHFIENFWFGFLIVLAMAVVRLHRGKPAYTEKQAAWRIWAWGTGIGSVWEVYQWTCDAILGSKMAFDSYQTWLSDTLSDLLGGQLGIFLGILFICLPFWSYLFGSIRRRDGD